MPRELGSSLKSSVASRLYNGELLLQDLTYNYSGAKNTCFRVYSDREENIILEDASPDAGVRSIVDFLETLVVVEIRGTWLHVRSEARPGKDDKCVDLGWIPVARTVLNSRAILTDEGITKKALTITESAKPSPKGPLYASSSNNSLDIFYSSENSAYIENVQKDTEVDLSFEIRYVLKEANGKQLLSVRDDLSNISEQQLKKEVTGWINSSKITNWNTRVGLKKAYGKYYVGAYPNMPIPIFNTRDDLEVFQESDGLDSVNRAIFKLEIKEEKGFRVKMPHLVLKNLNKTDRKVVTFVKRPGDNRKLQIEVETPEKSINNLTKIRDLGSAEANRISNYYGLLPILGYTSTIFYDSKLPCFKPVVLMSSQEVDSIVTHFSRYNPNASITIARKQLYEGLSKLFQVMLSEDSPEQVRNKTMDEIWQILSGEPFDANDEYGKLGQTRLSDIPNLDDPYLIKFIQQFQLSISLFTKRNIQKHQFTIMDDDFYWIPIEEIPGHG